MEITTIFVKAEYKTLKTGSSGGGLRRAFTSLRKSEDPELGDGVPAGRGAGRSCARYGVCRTTVDSRYR
ncbi:hypothetical protein E2C01_000894 [Portunus trituberculatus]|uniref:Uncharacterized protein n=1 Tax=Portunus trituberculatus TaxID=210409 RepID=A0A5B7CL55_PORTR|nr:hypothetical protein [Portunus trituberculatus]